MACNINQPRNRAKKVYPSTRGRPAPLIHRPASFNKYHHKATHSSTKNNTTTSSKEEDISDSMAVSFLQFCPICEKQIITPSNSLLYCSESCRKKDSTMSHTAPLILEQTPPASPFSANFSVDDLPIRDILPRRSPTARRPRSLARSDTSRDEDGDSSHDRTVRDSEASRYLRQFQSSASLSDVRTNGCRSEAQRSYSSTTMNTTPSLSFSHTPTSSTCASVAHSFSNNSTLHPRTTPQSTSLSTRGLDLVLPATVYPASSQPSTPSGFSKAEATATATSLSTAPLQSASATKSLPAMAKPSDDVAADALLTYPKQWPLPTPWEPGSPGAAGSLKQLFCWSDMETSASIKRPVWGSTGDLQGFW